MRQNVEVGRTGQQRLETVTPTRRSLAQASLGTKLSNVAEERDEAQTEAFSSKRLYLSIWIVVFSSFDNLAQWLLPIHPA